ncbi:MAG: hypothetical protein KF900_11740 [Bacteroidetes bacterium]|nr:hypothetical protein [Bacteroidota bacterium]
MSNHNTTTNGTLIGTVSGTALTVIVNISSSDVIKTTVLAALGAVVSFSVSLLLKRLTKK